MTQTTYELIQKAYAETFGEDSQYKTKIGLKNPILELNVTRHKYEGGPSQLSEIWFNVVVKKPITEEQVSSAIKLFSPPGRYDGGAICHYTSTHIVKENINLEQFSDLYSSNRDKMGSILEKSPAASLTGKILDSPIEVPDHEWRWIYCAFIDSDPEHPEYGETWNSVALHKDGLKLRICKSTNIIHAVSPLIAQALEQADPETEEETTNLVNQILPLAAEQEGLTFERDIFQRMRNAPKPIILGSELNLVSNFVSELVGVDITKLDYSVENIYAHLADD